MRKRVLISMIVLTTIIACNKNQYNTVPSLKYVKVNTTSLHNFETLQFTLSFTDKEGDLTDSLTVIEVPKKICNLSTIRPILYKLPAFPNTKNVKGDLVVTFHYNDFPAKCGYNDTSVFKFVLKDQAKHVSDTATSETIVIYN